MTRHEVESVGLDYAQNLGLRSAGLVNLGARFLAIARYSISYTCVWIFKAAQTGDSPLESARPYSHRCKCKVLEVKGPRLSLCALKVGFHPGPEYTALCIISTDVVISQPNQGTVLPTLTEAGICV